MSEQNGFSFWYRLDADKIVDEREDQLKSAKLWEELLEVDRDELAYEITRDEPDDNPDVTFSMQALFGLRRALLMFVGSRMARHWKRTGKPARKMTVVIAVKIEDEDA